MTRRINIARSLALLLILALVALVGTAVREVTDGPPTVKALDPLDPPHVKMTGYLTAQGPLVTGVRSVPVLVYHELNNGCRASAPVCEPHTYQGAVDPESVSTTQFARQMEYLHQAGYHTVTMTQYLAWLSNRDMLMPRKPILLIADNGIGPFLLGAQPVLLKYRFYMTAAVVTGFADGAAGHCPDVSLQPGCGKDNKHWDLTWEQLRSLGGEYNFILEAGRSGHFQQDYDPHCRMFYTCRLPGETIGAYQHRVVSENVAGRAELARELAPRVSTSAWVAPYGDLGYPQCAQSDCTPQDSTSPRGWLVRWAAGQYQAVFVEDAFRNGFAHERFRIDVNGWMNLAYFESLIQADNAAGDFR